MRLGGGSERVGGGSGHAGGGGGAQAARKVGFGGRCAKEGPDLAAWRAQSFGAEVDEAHLPGAADPRACLPRATDPRALH
jgi:hypothetical protein